MSIKLMTNEQLEKLTFIHHGHDTIDKNLFNEIRNIPLHPKPMYGFWGSEYTPNEKYISSWHSFFIDAFSPQVVEKFNSCHVTFNLKKNSKIILLDSLIDLKILHKKYPAPLPKGLPSFSLWTIVDWEGIYNDGYDGVYISHEGINSLYYSLYGWDVESILLFNLDCMEE